MNALNFGTIVPQMLVRQARTTDAAAATPETERVVTFATDSAVVPAELRSIAINASQDMLRRDLAPLLKLVTWIFQPMAQRKNILLRLEAPNFGLFATCQEMRIQRVLENLLTNALRHAPANSQVTLAARVESGRICIWVDDHGAGVSLAEQASLFDGEESSFGEYAYGVHEDKRGLVTSRDIVRAHGGDILMYNRPDGGAHFEFRLPASNDRHGSHENRQDFAQSA